MQPSARSTCCTTFGRTHRFWCLFAWLFTPGMHLAGGFPLSDVAQSNPLRHLRCRSGQNREKPESALGHLSSDKDEIHREHDCEQVGEPADLASATAERFD